MAGMHESFLTLIMMIPNQTLKTFTNTNNNTRLRFRHNLIYNTELQTTKSDHGGNEHWNVLTLPTPVGTVELDRQQPAKEATDRLVLPLVVDRLAAASCSATVLASILLR